MSHRIKTGSGPTQASYPMGTRDSFPGRKERIKQQRDVADRSPPLNAKVKNCGAIPPLLSMSAWHSA
jgi:hypothetical protein